MKLHLLSYNVQGLNNSSKTWKLRNYIKIVQPPCDVVLLQEHKLSGSIAMDLGKNIWPDAACYALDAQPGYTFNLDGAGKGGACILVSPYLKHLIVSYGCLRNNCVIWIILAGLPIGRMGIISIYASNYSRKHNELWESLLTILDNSCTVGSNNLTNSPLGSDCASPGFALSIPIACN
jgi:exonuclease III